MNKKIYTDKDFEAMEKQISLLMNYARKLEQKIKSMDSKILSLESKIH